MQFEDVRFLSTLAVIGSHAAVLHLIAALDVRGAPMFLTQPILLGSLVFLYIWFTVFGQWVSRARRATFDEHNLLVTYQPRALTHGHLFVPDPPTPAVSGTPNAESSTASEFRKARDAHYRDEFHHAKQSVAERKFIPTAPVESMRIEFEDPSSPSSTVSSTKSTSPGHHI